MQVFIVWLVVSFAVLVPARAATIHIHTNNPTDKANLQNGVEESISVATNLLVLDTLADDIRFSHMTSQRSLQHMDRGESICVVNRVKNPSRVEKYWFSLPVNIYIGFRLYQNAKFPALANPSQPVDLLNVFRKRYGAKLLLAAQGSYGAELDKLLTRLPKRNKIYRGGTDHDEGITRMFNRGRAEFVLYYPQLFHETPLGVPVNVYQLAGVSPYILGHFMCSRTPQTKDFLARLNNRIRQLYQSGQLLEVNLAHTTESDRAVVTQYFNQMLALTSQ